MGYAPQPGDTPAGEWTTQPGAADPNAAARPGAQLPEAPDYQTQAGAAPDRSQAIDWSREFDTSGMSLTDPAEQARARAASVDFDGADTTPNWGTEAGAAPARQGLELPPRDFDTAGLSLAERMGIDPNAGPLSKVATAAVNSGAHEAVQQAHAAQAAAELLADHQPAEPKNAPDVSNADAPGALPSGSGRPVGADAAGGQQPAGRVPANDGGRDAHPAGDAAGGGREGLAAPAAGQRGDAALADLRKKWPGLADKSDDHVRAAEDWSLAERRLKGNLDWTPLASERVSAIQDQLIHEMGGQAGVAKNQTGYLRTLTQRLNAESEKLETERNTPGTLANKRQEKSDQAAREHTAAAMQKATAQDIEHNLERVRELRRQGRISAADELRLLTLAQSSTDGFDAAMKLEGFVSDKAVPGRQGEVRNEQPAANEAAAPKGAPGAPLTNEAPKGGLSVGMMPNTAEPVSVRGGVVHIGKHEAINFDSGEPIVVREGATNQEIRDALTAGGAISRHQKIFGGKEEKPAAQVEPKPEAPAQSAPEPVHYGQDHQLLSDRGKPFATRKDAQKAKKLQPMMMVVTPVEGGYALREKTEGEIRAHEAAASHYNVTGHFEVEGDLYQRQGAAGARHHHRRPRAFQQLCARCRHHRKSRHLEPSLCRVQDHSGFPRGA
jgi:hypothetical protein